jgi:2-isopropylmalate synthase
LVIHRLVLTYVREGTGIAAAELGQMAGADRVEGTLFGNGERTGNVDIVNLALNLYTQGISPKLDFSDLQAVIDVVTHCNDLPIHPRHPYAGELVHTAFSGSHQDAIKKGFEAQNIRHQEAVKNGENLWWDIPYLPIDPADLGETYEAVIRVNSQSGKGGISYLVKQHLQLDLPRKMQIAFYQVVQEVSDREAREMTIEDITTAFRKTYFFGGPNYQGRLVLRSFKISAEAIDDMDQLDVAITDAPDERRRFDGTLSVDGVLRVIRGDGNGPLSAFLNALRTHLDIDLTVREYTEHSVGEGAAATAASYVELVPTQGTIKDTKKSTQSWWGVGVDTDIAASGLRAVVSAVNAAIGDRALPELKLSVGFYARSGQADIASKILNSFGLELPRRLQSAFFEVVQRTAQDQGGEISYQALLDLFKTSYGYEGTNVKLAMSAYTMEHLESREGRLINVDVIADGEQIRITGQGNGPLSALLDALNSTWEGTLSIKDYSEHSVGEGTEVKAASYVELVYEAEGQSRTSAWGVATDTDIASSGLKAVFCAADKFPRNRRA